MTGVLVRTTETDTHREETQTAGEKAPWRWKEVGVMHLISQGTPRIASNHLTLRRSRDRSFLRACMAL